MFKELEVYAHAHDVPIMSRESIQFISNVLIEYHSRSLLEVGTAIAYSTLCFSTLESVQSIVTIERDKERYQRALENIAKFDINHKINAVEGDGLRYTPQQSFDVVLLDAAKAQNEAMFKLYFAFTNTIMIIDNVDFHGFTGHSQEIKSRNLRQMIQRIESFLRYLETRKDLEVTKHDIGDGILVIKRRAQ